MTASATYVEKIKTLIYLKKFGFPPHFMKVFRDSGSLLAHNTRDLSIGTYRALMDTSGSPDRKLFDSYAQAYAKKLPKPGFRTLWRAYPGLKPNTAPALKAA